MKASNTIKKICVVVVIIVVVMSFPYLLFKIHADSFIRHKFTSIEDTRICIESYESDIEIEVENPDEKKEILSVLQSELKYVGPQWYRIAFQIGKSEIYCIRIYDYGDSGNSWIIYISDNPDHNYMNYGNVYGSKLAVNHNVIEMLRVYID